MRYSILFILILIVSCAPVKVNFDYDRATDFSQYHTYHYYIDMSSGLSELDEKRLVNTLDAAFEAKGFSKSESPDLFVNIVSSEYQSNSQSSVGVGLGGGSGGMGGGVSVGIPVGQTQVNQVLQFDFVDENGVGLVWQAVAEVYIQSNASPEQREIQFKKIVEKVMAGFPPQMEN